MKKLLFVYNPRAGKEMLKPRLSDVLDIFVKAGYEVTVHPTQAYRDAYYQIDQGIRSRQIRPDCVQRWRWNH